jgi:hypothetical protein
VASSQPDLTDLQFTFQQDLGHLFGQARASDVRVITEDLILCVAD